MRILSLGAGVQSSALLLMACEGELVIDCAIFADTQWEPPAVYRHLTWLETVARDHSIPVYHVTRGSLREDAINGKPEAWMPLYTRNHDGSRSMLKRQCTSNYKIVPIKRKIRDLGATRKNPATVLKGISLDEALRMKDSDVQYIQHEYPLIDRRMTRSDCKTWLTRHGYPIPPKSSCIGCPYHDNAGWRAIHADPDAWSNAVEFDAAIRMGGRITDAECFVHRLAIPLASVDMRTAQDRGQLDMFTDECGGVCGV